MPNSIILCIMTKFAPVRWFQLQDSADLIEWADGERGVRPTYSHWTDEGCIFFWMIQILFIQLKGVTADPPLLYIRGRVSHVLFK